MERSTQQVIIDKILNEQKSKKSDVAPHSSTVAVSNYISSERYKNECDVLFRNTPLIVGRSSDVKNEGDFITFNETEVPVLIVRGKDGNLRAFINVCRHRGTVVVQENAGRNKKSFSCPYHSWTYNTEGELIAIPHEYGFDDCDKSQLGLRSVPVAERFGFIWCAPGGSKNIVPDAWLGNDVCEDFSSYGIDHDSVYDVRIVERPINWKLTVDTFLENYHVKHAHRTTIDHYFLDNISVSDNLGKHIRIIFPKKTILELEKIKPGERPDIRNHANILYAIFPNTLILIEPDHISVSHVYPKGIDATKVVSYTLLKTLPDNDKAKNYWDKNNNILYTALEEDFDMAGLVQKGLHSNANEKLIHGKFEKGLKFFHAAIDHALAGV